MEDPNHTEHGQPHKYLSSFERKRNIRSWKSGRIEKRPRRIRGETFQFKAPMQIQVLIAPGLVPVHVRIVSTGFGKIKNVNVRS
jgi:hypothetical protein